MGFLAPLFPPEEAALHSASFSTVKTLLGARLERIDELEAWLAFQNECNALEGLGLATFLQSARAAKLEGNQLKPAFFKRFYSLWLDAVYEKCPVLRQSEELHRKHVTQFCRAPTGTADDCP